MYAVIETGGKQYRVQEGDIISVEKLGLVEGDKYNFDHVLMVATDAGIKSGNPCVADAVVLQDFLGGGYAVDAHVGAVGYGVGKEDVECGNIDVDHGAVARYYLEIESRQHMVDEVVGIPEIFGMGIKGLQDVRAKVARKAYLDLFGIGR